MTLLSAAGRWKKGPDRLLRHCPRSALGRSKPTGRWAKRFRPTFTPLSAVQQAHVCCARSSLCLPERNALPPAARSAVGSSTLRVFYKPLAPRHNIHNITLRAPRNPHHRTSRAAGLSLTLPPSYSRPTSPRPPLARYGNGRHNNLRRGAAATLWGAAPL